MKRIGCSGMTTATSQPGGIFGAPPQPVVRPRLDGRTDQKGRGNASSIAGGVLAWDPERPAPAQPPPRTFHPTTQNAFEGAAGGRATNAHQVRDGHFRGGLPGRGGQPMSPAMMPMSPMAHARGAYGGAYQSPRAQPANDSFLDALDEAEQRDDEEHEHLMRLQQAAADRQMVKQAAAQLAAEQGLSPEQAAALEEQLAARLVSQAEEAEAAYSPPPPPPPQMSQGDALMAAKARRQQQQQQQQQMPPPQQYQPQMYSPPQQQYNPHSYNQPPPPPPQQHYAYYPGGEGMAQPAGGYRRPGSAGGLPVRMGGECRPHGYECGASPLSAGAWGSPTGANEYNRPARRPGSAAFSPGGCGMEGAAGGRAANTKQLMMRDVSGGYAGGRDVNASSISGGIFA